MPTPSVATLRWQVIRGNQCGVWRELTNLYHYIIPSTISIRQALSLFCRLFMDAGFSGLDEMHLIGLNFTDLVMRLLSPVRRKEMVVDGQEGVYPFLLSGRALEKCGECMMASRSSIPRKHFDGDWDNIIRRSNGRAVNWLLYAVPTLIIPFLTNVAVKPVLNNLIKAIHLALQRKTRTGDINLMER